MTQQARSTLFAGARTAIVTVTLPFVCTSCRADIRSVRSPRTCPGCGGDDFALARSPASEVVFVADPGHGWLLVTPERYRAYGLKAARISPSSCFAPDACLFALEEDSFSTELRHSGLGLFNAGLRAEYLDGRFTGTLLTALLEGCSPPGVLRLEIVRKEPAGFCHLEGAVSVQPHDVSGDGVRHVVHAAIGLDVVVVLTQ